MLLVGSLQPYSDHCPLIFVLKAAIVLPSMEPSPICEFPLTDLLRWNKENFISSLEQNDVVTRVLELKTLLSSESIDCDAGAEQITELLTNLMSKSLRKPRDTRVRTNKNRFPRKRWFDEECKTQKRVVNSARKNLQHFSDNQFNRENYFMEKRIYKKMVKRKREAATIQHYQMLVSAQKTDPKRFWKCISRAKRRRATFSHIDPKAFLSHFTNLNMSSENDSSVALPQSATPSPYIPELDDDIYKRRKKSNKQFFI